MAGILLLLIFAGVVGSVAVTPLVVDLAVGGALVAGILALLHGDFGSALFALAVLVMVRHQAEAD